MKISIIIPCYNQAQYLDECLQSVLEQTYQDWECIIVDDGSPDNTEEIAQKWVQKDTRFQYYKKENGGVSSARNFGIEKAHGEWILPLDGDDKIGKEYLSLAIEKLNSGYDLVYCNADYFGGKNEAFFLPEYTFNTLLKYNVIFCSALYNKEKLNGIRYDEKLIHGLEDWEFWISYLSQPEMNVFKLPEILFYYRIKTVSRNENINKDHYKMNDTKMYILKKHQKLYFDTFGDYFYLLGKMSSVERENAYYKKIINSKKYQFINKIIGYINKFRP